MLKIEIFYNGDIDTATPKKADEFRSKYGDRIDLYLVDVSKDTSPAKYGTINPPELVLDGKQRFRLEGPDSLSTIVRCAIF